jgi:hypothetical protein
MRLQISSCLRHIASSRFGINATLEIRVQTEISNQNGYTRVRGEGSGALSPFTLSCILVHALPHKNAKCFTFPCFSSYKVSLVKSSVLFNVIVVKLLPFKTER